jgi:hypothetical protein
VRSRVRHPNLCDACRRGFRPPTRPGNALRSSLRCLRVSPRRYAVFAVLTGSVRLCSVSYVEHGSVIQPNHAQVARLLIADDDEVGHPTELQDSSFRVLSEAL